jgi:DNA-directed RNA polymerase specialized sigma24 family protein
MPSFRKDGYTMAGAAGRFGEPHCGRFSEQISPRDLQILVREAESAARRLARSLRLPRHEHDDVRQDLLLDLIARWKHFDPSRGSSGAFAGMVLRNCASGLARRICRERVKSAVMRFGDNSPQAHRALDDTPLTSNDEATKVGEEFLTIENRVAIHQALGTLRVSDLAVCAALLDATPTELSQSETFSRANLYRQIREIRMRFLIAGFAAVA